MEKERVGWFTIDNLPENTLDGLNWLVPLANYLLNNKNEMIGEGTRKVFFKG